MSTIDIDRVNGLVLRKQHLTDDSRAASLVEMVWDVGGLHATSAIGPYLSSFVRCADFQKADLDRELYANKSLGRLRCMRRTMYIQPTGAFSIYHSAFEKMYRRGVAGALNHAGISARDYERLEEEILRLLQDGGKTASELKKALGVGTSLFSVLNAMCGIGLLAKGPPKGSWKSNLHTYHLFGEYYPDVDLAMDEVRATAALVLQYLKAFGPAIEADVVWWTGLRKSSVREALEDINDKRVYVEVAGLDKAMIAVNADLGPLREARPFKSVRLLPSLDPYLMGYKDRGRYLDNKYYGHVYDRSGNATTTILADGELAGVWDVERGEKTMIKVFLFEKANKGLLEELSRQATSVGAFMAGGPVEVVRCDSMTPLAQRPPGAVMSPLKDRSDL